MVRLFDDKARPSTLERSVTQSPWSHWHFGFWVHPAPVPRSCVCFLDFLLSPPWSFFTRKLLCTRSLERTKRRMALVTDREKKNKEVAEKGDWPGIQNLLFGEKV